MSYKRTIMPAIDLEANELTQSMTGIGMLFAVKADYDANIENTLYFASIDGMENPDLRTLSMLISWIDIHSRWINVDRLTRLIEKNDSVPVNAFWTAVALWKKKDRRFHRLSKRYSGKRFALELSGSDFLIRRHGEDPRFRDGPILIAANVLRDRKTDVLSPSELAKRHSVYRWRVLIGPGYRADMWAALSQDPTLSASQLARKAYGSFATAHQVKRDWLLLKEIFKNMVL